MRTPRGRAAVEVAVTHCRDHAHDSQALGDLRSLLSQPWTVCGVETGAAMTAAGAGCLCLALAATCKVAPPRGLAVGGGSLPLQTGGRACSGPKKPKGEPAAGVRCVHVCACACAFKRAWHGRKSPEKSHLVHQQPRESPAGVLPEPVGGPWTAPALQPPLAGWHRGVPAGMRRTHGGDGQGRSRRGPRVSIRWLQPARLPLGSSLRPLKRAGEPWRAKLVVRHLLHVLLVLPDFLRHGRVFTDTVAPHLGPHGRQTASLALLGLLLEPVRLVGGGAVRPALGDRTSRMAGQHSTEARVVRRCIHSSRFCYPLPPRPIPGRPWTRPTEGRSIKGDGVHSA